MQGFKNMLCVLEPQGSQLWQGLWLWRGTSK